MIFLREGGAELPALGFGTYKLTGAVCREAVATALGCGYRHIDTASFYGNELEVGQAISDAGVGRDELFITTKVWRTELGAQDVFSSVEDSLRKLGISYLDLLLIHWPNPAFPLEETVSAMARLQAEGKVRHIGGSNFTVDLLRRAITVAPLACNQVEYHPFLSQETLLDAMRQMGLALVAYAPLARGRVFREEALREVADLHGKTRGQVALRWLLQQDGVGALPKATGRAHIEENFDVFDFELSDGEMGRIHGVACGQRLVSPEWAPRWDL